VSREFDSQSQVGAALDQELRHREPAIAELGDGVENGRLPANASLVSRGARIDVCSSIQQEPCRVNIAELCGHVQQRRSLKEHAACARAAAVQFRKSSVDQR
jgi:hypothetical protein